MLASGPPSHMIDGTDRAGEKCVTHVAGQKRYPCPRFQRVWLIESPPHPLASLATSPRKRGEVTRGASHSQSLSIEVVARSEITPSNPTLTPTVGAPSSPSPARP